MFLHEAHVVLELHLLIYFGIFFYSLEMHLNLPILMAKEHIGRKMGNDSYIPIQKFSDCQESMNAYSCNMLGLCYSGRYHPE